MTCEHFILFSNRRMYWTRTVLYHAVPQSLVELSLVQALTNARHSNVALDGLARVCTENETRDVATLGPVRVHRQLFDSVRRVPQVDLSLASTATRQTATERV